MNNRNSKVLARNLIWKISPSLSCAITYIKHRHRIPNFKTPDDLSEIVFSQMISGEVKKFAPFADKIEVRNYIKEWGLERYLPQLYGVWDNADEIDFDKLPNKFALKANNYCDGHIFCHDKSTLNKEFARNHMNEQMKNVQGVFRELQYLEITPKIFAEELIEDPKLLQPIDYKFMCCDGRVNGCLLCSERGTKNDLHLSFYDNDWNKRDDFMTGNEVSSNDFDRPPELGEMIDVAERIAQHFTQVRVDLYDVGGKVYLGELTFTPEGGLMKYYSNKAVDYLGHRKKRKGI